MCSWQIARQALYRFYTCSTVVCVVRVVSFTSAIVVRAVLVVLYSHSRRYLHRAVYTV